MSITANETNNLVVLVSRGLDDERATVAWTLANAGVASGQNVTVFCVSAGVDILRSNHGPVVMEVNSSPGLEGIEQATGKDVAGMIIQFLEKNARPNRTGTRGRG